MTQWHRACSYRRHGRRRRIGCDNTTAPTRQPAIRSFVESPLDAAMVLLEERRAELSLLRV